MKCHNVTKNSFLVAVTFKSTSVTRQLKGFRKTHTSGIQTTD